MTGSNTARPLRRASTKPPRRIARPLALTVVAVLLAWAGFAWIVYAPFAPPAYPLLTHPMPAVAIPYGLAHLVVAVGIFRLWPAARPAVTALIALDAGTKLVLLTALGIGTGQAPFFDILVLVGELAVDAAMLWVVLRRWPA